MPEFNEAKPVLDALTEFSKQAALLNLTEAGVDTNFVQPMLEMLNSNVASGANINDLLDELKLFVVGSNTVDGKLTRYIKQVAHDSLIQFSATYAHEIALSTGMQFYRYVGTRIRDTRPFCVDFLNDYFHKKEVEDLGRGVNPQTGNKLTSDQKKGRIAGTNSSNIFTNRGGWNCRHQFTAVNTQFVPKPVIVRNIAKGNYVPSVKMKGLLSL